MDAKQSLIGHVVDEFLEALRSGESPSVDDFVKRHPDLGGDLREMLELILAMEGNGVSQGETLIGHNSRDEVSFLLSPSVADTDAASAPQDKTFIRNPNHGGRPRSLGKFELIAKVGEGGFGQVWKAWDTQLGRTVAIKFLKRHLSQDPDTRERFLREARALGQLRHPGIVPVFEVADIHGGPAIISDFVEGVTLCELIKHRRIDFDEIAVLMSDVAEAIEYAHSMNLIHRDIKPANIMVDYQSDQNLDTRLTPVGSDSSGKSSSKQSEKSRAAHVSGPRPRVLDFGLALRSDSEATMTIEGQVLGTPGYMSPEQARGAGHHADCRSDIYSMGVVMYELLCGQPPFAGSNVSIVHQVIYDEPRKPRTIRADIPIDLETICLKAMAKQPGERYSSARELSADLMRWLNDEPIEARPPTPSEQFRRWFRRHPALAGSVVAIFVMMLIFTCVSVVYAFNYQRLAQKADKALIKQTEALSLSQTTLQHMYTSFGNQAEKNGQPIQGAPWFVKALQQTRQLHEIQPAQSWENCSKPYWLQLQNCSLTSNRPVRAWWQPGPQLESQPEVSNLFWHPTGRWLIVHGDRQVATIWDLQNDKHWGDLPSQTGTKPTNQDVEMSEYSQARWSPNGQSLLMVKTTGQIEVRTVGWWEVAQRGQSSHPVQAVAWLDDPHAPGVILLGPDSFSIHRVDDLQCLQTVACPAAGTSLHVHRNADWVAVPCVDSFLRVYQRNSQTGLFELSLETASTCTPLRRHTDAAFLGDDELVFHTADQTIGKLHLPDRRVTTLPIKAESLSVSPSGRYSFASQDFSGQVIDNSDGRGLGEPVKHKNHIMALAFSSNERLLVTASGDRTVGLFDAQSGRRLLPWIQHQHDLRAVSVSPDRRYVASAQLDGMVRVWDVPKPYRFVPTGPGDQFLEISQDGQAFIPGRWEAHRCRQTLQVFDIRTGSVNSEPLKVSGCIDGAYLSPDRTQVAVAYEANSEVRDVRDELGWLSDSEADRAAKARRKIVENQVCFWNPLTGKVSESLAIGALAIGGAWSPDGRLVAFVSYQGDITVIDAQKRKIVKTMQQGNDFAPFFITRGHIRFSPDGRTLAVWTMLRTSVWQTDNWELLTDYQAAPVGLQHFTHHVTYSHDSRFLAICTSTLKTTIIDLKTTRVVGELPHPDWVFSAVFSPDNQTLLTACRDGLVRAWDWRRGRQTLPPLQHQDEAFGVDVSSDGQWIVTSGRDCTVRFWQASTGRPMTPALTLPDRIYDVQFTSDDQFVLASGRAPGVAIFDCAQILQQDDAYMSLSDDNLIAYGELLSAQRMVGDDVTNLTSSEWLEVWTAYTQKNGLPAFTSGTLAPEK